MKRKNLVAILMVLGFVALAPSSLTAQFFAIARSEADLAQIVSNINKAGGVAVIAMGIDMNGREDLATRKALLDGRTQISQAFETNIENLEKMFIEEIGSGGQTEINESFSSVTKAVSKSALRGSIALSNTIPRVEGSKVTVKVVVGIEPRVLNTAFLEELKNTNAALYESLITSNVYDAMSKQAEKLKEGK